MITNQSSTNQAQRPQFYENEYLGAADLTAIVKYSRLQQQRHALGAHTWGIAMGLQLKEKPSPAGSGQVDTYIQPGYAWDGFGSSIVVLAPYKIPAGLFSSIPYDGSMPGGQQIKVWLRYNEIEAQGPRPGFAVCDPADQFARVQESFQIEVGERRNLSDQRDPVVIAGRAVDASLAFQTFDPKDPLIYDASVPYQTFPDDNPNALWLIPLGFVHWNPNQNPNQPGNFVALSDDERKGSRMFRQYISVVAEGIQAADGIIRMRNRTTDDSMLAWSDDLVWVEGKLRVNGDTRLFGSKLSFLDSSGQDNSVPLVIKRLPNNPQGGVDLQIGVGGKANQGKNRFAVGHLDASDNVVESFVVTDDGKVGIGTTTPGTGLQVATHLAVGPFSATQNTGGIDVTGVQAELSFVRQTLTSWPTNPAAGDRFTWYNPDGTARLWTEQNKDLLTVTSTGSVGIGTTTPARKLHVEGSEVHSGNAGAGFSFGNRETAGFVNNPPAGERWVWYSSSGNARLWSRDDKLVVTPAGSVGFGTATPSRKLHVEGDEIHSGGGRAGFSFGNRETAGFVESPPAGERWVWYSSFGIARLWSGGDKLVVTTAGDIKLGPNASLFAPGGVENLRIIRGTVRADGTVVAGSGFTVGSGGSGVYTITFSPSFPQVPFGSVTQIFNGGGGGGDTRDNAVIIEITNTSAKLKTGDSLGVATNRDFTFFFVGTR